MAAAPLYNRAHTSNPKAASTSPRRTYVALWELQHRADTGDHHYFTPHRPSMRVKEVLSRVKRHVSTQTQPDHAPSISQSTRTTLNWRHHHSRATYTAQQAPHRPMLASDMSALSPAAACAAVGSIGRMQQRASASTSFPSAQKLTLNQGSGSSNNSARREPLPLLGIGASRGLAEPTNPVGCGTESHSHQTIT